MDVLRTTASEWQDRLQHGETTSRFLTASCLEQIKHHNKSGMRLNALISMMPEQLALEQAAVLDYERASGKLRSPLHGIPIIIKDTFPTDGSLGMPTTVGAAGLATAYGKQNCLLVQRLLDAGMIILGKGNLTEFCGLKTSMRVGWSALGGQTQSPYMKGGVKEDEAPVGHTMIAGSSSGPAASVAAGFAPLAIGTETTGSLVAPANRAGLHSLKVTPERAPKAGTFCLSKTYDSLGGMAKSAKDLRALTSVIMNKDVSSGRAAGSETLRVGFVDSKAWQWPDIVCELSQSTRDELLLHAVRISHIADALAATGVKVVKDIQLSPSDVCNLDGQSVVRLVAFSEFRECFNDFASQLIGTTITTLSDLIKYNQEHKDIAMPPPFEDQEQLVSAEADSTSNTQRVEAFEHARKMARDQGLDQVMAAHDVDLIIGPGDSDLYTYAAYAGYPNGTMPLSTIEFGESQSRPEGLSIIARAGSERTILDFMEHYEKLVKRPLPTPLL